MLAGVRNSDSRKPLTNVALMFKIRLMRIADIEKALVEQKKLDKKQLKLNLDEQASLLPYVMRLRDLKKDAEIREIRARRIMATLGEEQFETLSDSLKDGEDVSQKIGLVTNGNVPLWEMMAAIVEQQPGIQVVELELALEHFGHKTSRQAIESALKTHKSEFETKTRGRQKFVSLKGA